MGFYLPIYHSAWEISICRRNYSQGSCSSRYFRSRYVKCHNPLKSGMFTNIWRNFYAKSPWNPRPSYPKHCLHTLICVIWECMHCGSRTCIFASLLYFVWAQRSPKSFSRWSIVLAFLHHRTAALISPYNENLESLKYPQLSLSKTTFFNSFSYFFQLIFPRIWQ